MPFPDGTLVLRRQQPAMATSFEVVLAGGDAEHLEAVAAACFDEIARIERLLSRFDPAGEVARINREAPHHPVLVDIELWSILCDCLDWRDRTVGWFDVTAGSREAEPAPSDPSLPDVVLERETRTVRLRPGVRIDLGGYGKGYALDRARDIVRSFGVSSALLHGGTSSVLAVGSGPDGSGWPVGIGDPLDPARELRQLRLRDRGLSSSVALTGDGDASDILIPASGAPLEQQAGCVVVGPDALTAEVLSTALLAMGRSRAIAYIGSSGSAELGARSAELQVDAQGDLSSSALRTPSSAPLRVGWISIENGQAHWEWITPPLPANGPAEPAAGAS